MLPPRSMIWALISPILSLRSTSTGSSPFRILLRISGTHLGQSESVVRGQPSGGFCFSQDFRRGFSDHLGMNPGLGWMEFRVLNTPQATFAVAVTAFSTYLIGLCIGRFSAVSCIHHRV